ncbi:MAG: Hpt domain-containing protein [Lachnospiraceae bacterium]|nr:Hpt domain-containing protein [Lachnospiraceae bacterium]
MGADLSFLEGTGLDIKTGIGYTGSEEKYLSALQRYFNNYEKNRTKIEEYYNAGDNENYMITVHALKSNSRMIGATELGDMFEALETAVRNNEVDVIKEKTAKVLSKYAAVIESLKPIGIMGDLKAASEISAEEAKDISEKLLAALDDFDDELSKELVVSFPAIPST